MSTYNREFNAVYIHIPKTAGSSIESVSWMGGAGHWTIRDMARAASKSGAVVDLDRAFKFTVVRDPLDRFVSCFFHKQYPHIDNWGYEGDKEGFTRFVRMAHEVGIREDLMYPEPGNWHLHHHFIPQWYFICDASGKLMMDFIGRFHCLDLDWRTICVHVGVEYEALPHLRRTERESSAYYYTSETEEMVRELYEKDYDLLGEFFP